MNERFKIANLINLLTLLNNLHLTKLKTIIDTLAKFVNCELQADNLLLEDEL